jgi:hypothetical protein
MIYRYEIYNGKEKQSKRMTTFGEWSNAEKKEEGEECRQE